jgi:NADH-quinone oxidoreductase subunit L
VQANKAALKALLVNRIGDLGFLIATALIFFLFRSLEFSVIFPLASSSNQLRLYFFLQNEVLFLLFVFFYLLVHVVSLLN